MVFSFSSTPRTLLMLALLAGAGVLPATTQAASKSGKSSDGLWQLQATPPAERSDREPFIQARRFQTFTANLSALRAALSKAPLDETTAAARSSAISGKPVEISLPMARGGKIERFQVVEVGIMAPELAAKYPDIKTYRGVGLDDPRLTVALDVTPLGFHAQMKTPKGTVFISPYYFGGLDNVYASYRKQDAIPDERNPWACEFTGKNGKVAVDNDRVQPQIAFGGSLRTYRLACAANNVYVATTGGTKASGQAAIVTIINRVSAIYESELGIRLVLVANNDQVVYASAAADPANGQPTADPYSNGTGALNQNTANLNSVIGVNNYDIGHVFTTGSGGVAGLGVVCTSTKGRGTTGLNNPTGDAFSVDYVAHEMGHQFGGNHTFNGGVTNAGSCSGSNRSAAHAYEPGSGTTIMAYAGICGVNNDLQPNSDAFFHSESIQEILTFAAGTGASCPTVTTNSNPAPTVDAGLSYTIPANTPFILTGSATDANGFPLTYSWEERDRGTVQTDANAVDTGVAPLFRSFLPVYSPSRTFPKVSDLLNNTTTIGERLPTVARTLNFRLTARNNRIGGGANNSADMTLTVNTASGPFRVTAPNTAVTTPSGAPLSVTWNVANTNLAPVNTTLVNIRLSTDGGYTYPIILAANTANDGAESVTLPAGVTSSAARIKVEAVNNVYFDISDANFTIN